MKILYLSHHFHTETGTFSSRPFLFAKELARQGHRVTVLAGKHDRGAVEIETSESGSIRKKTIDGINVVQVAVPYANKMSVLKRSLIFLQYTWECVHMSLTSDYDLLFATSGPLTVGIPGILARTIRMKTFVFEARDLLPETPKALGLITNPILLHTLSALEAASYRCANAAIGLAPGIVEEISRHCSKFTPIAMLPNGSELELFRKRDRSELSVKGLSKNDTIAVFTGAHGLTNGLHAILDAAHELRNRGRTDIKILFFGDGKIKTELLERKAKEGLDNCLFFDPIPKPELAKILGCVDVGLMTLKDLEVFYYSTSPNKFFDYLSCGLPIINNYPGWVAGLISRNNCGIGVRSGDPEQFADALEVYADDTKKREQHGVNARSLAEKEFNMAETAKRFVRFLEKIEYSRKTASI